MVQLATMGLRIFLWKWKTIKAKQLKKAIAKKRNWKPKLAIINPERTAPKATLRFVTTPKTVQSFMCLWSSKLSASKLLNAGFPKPSEMPTTVWTMIKRGMD